MSERARLERRARDHAVRGEILARHDPATRAVRTDDRLSDRAFVHGAWSETRVRRERAREVGLLDRVRGRGRAGGRPRAEHTITREVGRDEARLLADVWGDGHAAPRERDGRGRDLSERSAPEAGDELGDARGLAWHAGREPADLARVLGHARPREHIGCRSAGRRLAKVEERHALVARAVVEREAPLPRSRSSQGRRPPSASIAAPAASAADPPAARICSAAAVASAWSVETANSE
jgi:hypothetical protein